MNTSKALSMTSVITALLLSVSALPALATPAFTMSNTTGQALGNPPFTLGYAFSTNSAITITDLGIFDDSLDGLAESHDIGIWDNAGNLLASATVGSGTSGTLVDQFRYVSIGSLKLIAGATYRVGALYATGIEPLLWPGTVTDFTAHQEVNFLDASFASGATLSNPTSGFGGQGFFGPNFMIPEPGSLALLGLGLIGLAASRRRQS